MNRQALLLFVDGLGLGADDPAINPVVAAHTPCLDALLGPEVLLIVISTGRVDRG